MSEKKTHENPSSAIDDFLNNGTGRGSRNPRPGVGTFKLCLEKFNDAGVKETTALVKLENGTMAKAITKSIKGRVLTARVVESTCAANPVGSKVDLYFRNNATDDWAVEADLADLVELCIGFYGCFGLRPDRATYDTFVAMTSDKEKHHNVAGVEIGLSTRQAQKDGVVKTFKDGTPILFLGWQPIANDVAQVQARKAEILKK